MHLALLVSIKKQYKATASKNTSFVEVFRGFMKRLGGQGGCMRVPSGPGWPLAGWPGGCKMLIFHCFLECFLVTMHLALLVSIPKQHKLTACNKSSFAFSFYRVL